VINRRLEKTWALFGRKQETWLRGLWRRPGYSTTFLPESSPTTAPATPPKLQTAKAGTAIMKNHPLQEKIRFKTI